MAVVVAARPRAVIRTLCWVGSPDQCRGPLNVPLATIRCPGRERDGGWCERDIDVGGLAEQFEVDGFHLVVGDVEMEVGPTTCADGRRLRYQFDSRHRGDRQGERRQCSAIVWSVRRCFERCGVFADTERTGDRNRNVGSDGGPGLDGQCDRGRDTVVDEGVRLETHHCQRVDRVGGGVVVNADAADDELAWRRSYDRCLGEQAKTHGAPIEMSGTGVTTPGCVRTTIESSTLPPAALPKTPTT